MTATLNQTFSPLAGTQKLRSHAQPLSQGDAMSPRVEAIAKPSRKVRKTVPHEVRRLSDVFARLEIGGICTR